MSTLTNFVTVACRAPAHALEGLAAFFQIGAGYLVGERRWPEGEGRRRIPGTARCSASRLRLLRAFLPNLVLSKQFIGAYPNTGTAIVTRYQDVIEVLDRNADFEVVYEPKMRAITGGENFFLGMQDTALYARDVSNMRLAMRRDDVAAIVEPLARGLAEQLVAKQSNRIDVPTDLSLPVPTAIVTDYFGVAGARERRSHRLGDADVLVSLRRSRGRSGARGKALDAAAACRSVIDAAIAQPQGIGRAEGRRARPVPRPAEGRSARAWTISAFATI